MVSSPTVSSSIFIDMMPRLFLEIFNSLVPNNKNSENRAKTVNTRNYEILNICYYKNYGARD